ncbi:type III polyketide synthase [Metabacillus arenae]|uniref:Type III polyketide synthase n=1 Tax=Metabacillus arenae TaxID=2771434 RepID=A0A926NHX8_9BACI|nr:3-oxoacyl-[acyl-carrier-protein] synthase III C-terminal domain-containing protein [Metabacillus arenae]MBD1381641.1 type III polyketide synthase [Metabacillus arenae]
MGYILSAGTSYPAYEMKQDSVVEFARELFQDTYKDIDRLLKVFHNGEIKSRQFSQKLDWYKENHTFEDKNNTYIQQAVLHGVRAISNCLSHSFFLKQPVSEKEVEAIFFISSTGISTPSIDAKIMNQLPFKETTKRIPIWGLGCAGGASGLSRAYDYVKAYPKANVLVLAVELCSLTFQRDDLSKSNLIGSSLFSDGTAAILISGKNSTLLKQSACPALPNIIATKSVFMRDSEDVMGWNIKNNGLYVVFSRDIPFIIKKWLRPSVQEFLQENSISLSDLKVFLAHPGGKKVLQAYQDSLQLSEDLLSTSKEILERHGNMSSVTVMYVIKSYMEKNKGIAGDFGMIGALGPGFSSELLLVKWKEIR